MFGRRQRHEEHLYWEGFRDALVRGVRDPGKPMSGPMVAEQPRYPQGFEDGKRAAKRIHRDALVAEARKLSLAPGDTIVVKLGKPLNLEVVDVVKDALEGRFPENTILVLDEDADLSVVRPESIVVKVVAEAVARAAEDEAARS